MSNPEGSPEDAHVRRGPLRQRNMYLLFDQMIDENIQQTEKIQQEQQQQAQEIEERDGKV
jgi:hypothetical protein